MWAISAAFHQLDIHQGLPMKRPSCAKHFLLRTVQIDALVTTLDHLSSFQSCFLGGKRKGWECPKRIHNLGIWLKWIFTTKCPQILDRKHTPPTFLKPLHPITAHGTSTMITQKRTSGDDSEDLITLLISTCWISSTYSPENKKHSFFWMVGYPKWWWL